VLVRDLACLPCTNTVQGLREAPPPGAKAGLEIYKRISNILSRKIKVIDLLTSEWINVAVSAKLLQIIFGQIWANTS
jgi:hypothetical protein